MAATNWTTEQGRFDAIRERCAAFMASTDAPTTNDEEQGR